MKTTLDKLDGAEVNGRGIKLVEESKVILDPGPGLEATQGLVELVTKEVALNQGAEAVRLLRKTALGAVQGQDLVTGTVLNPKQDRENKRKILTVELKRSKVLQRLKNLLEEAKEKPLSLKKRLLRL